MDYTLVILDPYSNKPLQGVTVEAHSLDSGDIVATATSDTKGACAFTVAEEVSFHARSEHLPTIYQVVGAGTGLLGPFWYDYLIDDSWAAIVAVGGGTEGQTFTTFHGQVFYVYSTIAGAFAAAVAEGSNSPRAFLIAPGTYYEEVSATPPTNSDWTIHGIRGRSIWAADADSQALFTKGNQVNGKMHIDGVTFDQESNDSGVSLVNALNWIGSITNCDFFGGGSSTIHIKIFNQTGLTIENCLFQGSGYGIGESGGVTPILEMNIIGNIFLCDVGVECQQCGRTTITANFFNCNTADIVFTANSDEVTITANTFLKGISSVGTSSTDNLVISSNTFLLSSADTAIEIDAGAAVGGSYALTIFGNTILGVSGTLGIDIDDTDIHHGVVSLNTFKGLDSGDEIVGTPGPELQVFHNVSDAGALADQNSPVGHINSASDLPQHTHDDTDEGGTISHSDLDDLTSPDDHTQYALLVGRSGGQTLIGGPDAGDGLEFIASSNADKGNIVWKDAQQHLIQAGLAFDRVDLTVSSGRLDGASFPYVTLDGEGAAADDVASMKPFHYTTGTIQDGYLQVLRMADAAHAITIKHNDVAEGEAGWRFFLPSGADYVMQGVNDIVLAVYDSALGGWAVMRQEGAGIDHGALSGLPDDDHTQYYLADGSRELAGDLTFDSSNRSIVFQGSFLQITATATGVFRITSSALTLLNSIDLDANDIHVADGFGLVIGSSAQLTDVGEATYEAQIIGTADADSSLMLSRFSADALGSRLVFGKSRSGSVGTDTIVQDSDEVGEIAGYAADGTDQNTIIASYKVLVDDASPAANDIGGQFLWQLREGGASFRNVMRLRADGSLHLVDSGSLFLDEKSAADTDVAASGQFWVLDNTPNEAWFTDDAGTDYEVLLEGKAETPLEITIPLADPIVSSADTTLTPAYEAKEPWSNASRRINRWYVKFESNVGGDVTLQLYKNGSQITGAEVTVSSGTSESSVDSFTEQTLATGDVLTVVQTTSRTDAVQAVAYVYGDQDVVNTATYT